MINEIRWWVIFLSIAGLLVSVPFYVWSRRGKSYEARWWARSQFRGDITALVMLPAAMFFCISMLTLELDLVDTRFGWIIAVVDVAFIGWILIALVGSPIWHPLYRVFAPSWYANWSKEEQQDVELGVTLRRAAALQRPAWIGEVLFQGEARLWPDGDNPSLLDAHGGLLEIGRGGIWFFQANPDFSGKNTFEVRWRDLYLPKYSKPRIVMPWKNARRKFAVRGIGVVPRLVFQTRERTVLISFQRLDWLAVRPLVKKMKEGVYES